MGRTPSQKVLDAGELKNLWKGIMNPTHLDSFIAEVVNARRLREKIDWLKNNGARDKGTTLLYASLNREYGAIDPLVKSYMFENPFQIKDSKAISVYKGITPFYPAVMINISPNWKGRFTNYKAKKLRDAFDVRDFKAVIEKYLSSNDRYTKWKYCLECGSEGNFLHAHIVAEINPKCSKSVVTHVNKGNHAVELRKHWDKLGPEGTEGLLKGKFSIQRIIVRKREILKDKLAYLIEANKPEGHTNLSDLNLVFGGY